MMPSSDVSTSLPVGEGRPGEGRPAVILLSGGLDSATCLAIAHEAGYRCHAISFRYGQRHERLELEAATRVVAHLGADEHRVISLDLRAIGGSALTSDALDVPKGRGAAAIGGGVPVTYVPARNTIFLSIALAWAEVLESVDLFIGVNALDYSGYPDCRPAFIEAFEALAATATVLGTERGLKPRIHAPLLHLDKAAIVRRGIDLGVDYGLTHTCYDPSDDGRACGTCDACILRLKGFAEAGLVDPIAYEDA